MNRWTNVPTTSMNSGELRLFSNYEEANHAKRHKDSDADGNFPWTHAEGVACFEAYGWAGGVALARGLQAAWEAPRKPCFPPAATVSPDEALTVMLTKWAALRGQGSKNEEVASV